MKEILQSPPRTIMEVYKSLPEGTLAELIDNVIYMSPSPIYKHQHILQVIFRQLCNDVLDKNKGEVIVAPFDIYLDEMSNAVQPDITVILQNNTGRLVESGHFHGVPDFITEILSPGNKDFDLIKKKDLYERFGVKEYWAVDPESKLILGFALNEGKYKLISEDFGLLKSPLLSISIKF